MASSRSQVSSETSRAGGAAPALSKATDADATDATDATDGTSLPSRRLVIVLHICVRVRVAMDNSYQYATHDMSLWKRMVFPTQLMSKLNALR